MLAKITFSALLIAQVIGYSDGSVTTCGCIDMWRYDTISSNLLTSCTNPDNDPNGDWCMLSAYRSGGVENVHWKYTNNQAPEGDRECLRDWKYYNSDGTTCQANDCSVISVATKRNDNRYWCALPVYRPGGVRTKQWKYCLIFDCVPERQRLLEIPTVRNGTEE